MLDSAVMKPSAPARTPLRRAAVAAALAGMVLLGACGGDSTSDGVEPSDQNPLPAQQPGGDGEDGDSTLSGEGTDGVGDGETGGEGSGAPDSGDLEGEVEGSPTAGEEG